MGTSKNSFILRTAAISVGGVVRPKYVIEEAIGYACGDFDLPPCRRIFRTFSRQKQFLEVPFNFF